MATLITDKIDYKQKTVVRDKKRHYVLTVSIFQEDIIIINICNNGTLKHTKWNLTELKEAMFWE